MRFAARAFVDHGVSVQVGRGDRCEFRLRDIEFRLGAPSLIGIGGLCCYPESVTAFESLVIALAGPFATLLGMGLALALLPSLHGPLHAATALAAAAQFTGFVLNLVPFTLTDRSGRRFRTDGRRALDALQSMAGSGAPVSVPSISPAGPTPSCGRCGHSRGEHVDLTTGQPGGCLGQDYDFQSLSARVCDCGAFVATRAS